LEKYKLLDGKIPKSRLSEPIGMELYNSDL
jgi:hypothetical protein